MKKEQVELFESDNQWMAIFKMVGPALIAILVMLIYNMADMVFVGQTSETAQVAAISVVSPVFNIIMSVAMLISGGGTVLISKDLGAKDMEHAKIVSSLCIWAASILGILVGGLIILFRHPLLLLLGATPDIEKYALQYMVILAMGAPLLLLANMLGQVLRAEGAVTDGLIGNLIGTVINIILDPIFILGMNMGVVGAAVATVIGNIFAVVYYGFYMKRRAVVLNAKIQYAIKRPIYIFSVMALGVPNSLSTLLSGLANSFANQLLAKYGSDSIAANTAAGRVNLIIVMVLMGICMGAQPLIAYNYGAGNYIRLAAVIKRLLILNLLGGAVMSGAVIILRTEIIGLFLKDEAVAATAESILSILMISSPFLGLFYLGTNFLQATGKAMEATIVSTMQKGILLIPSLFIFEYIYKFMGIRLAYVVADFGSVIIAVILLIIEWKKTVEANQKRRVDYEYCA